MRKNLSLLLVILAFGLLSFLGACSDSSSGGSDAAQTDTDDSGDTTTPPSIDPVTGVADPAGNGLYTVKTITENLDSTQYDAAQIYYPEMDDTTPVPATTLCSGFLGQKKYVAWLAERIASHGFVVILFDPTDSSSLPANWEAGHKGCLATLSAENERLASPLYHRIDTARLCLAGYSMGGGGALLAADDLGEAVSNVIALHPWLSSVPSQFAISCPVLMFAGTQDWVAPTDDIETMFNALPGTSDSLFIEIRSAVHGDPSTGGDFHELYSNYIVAWLQYHVASLTAYLPYLAQNGDFQSDLAQYVYRYAQ